MGGPLARTVADAVTVFQVIAGFDPADPYTEPARGREIPRYADVLDADALRGARLGVMRRWSNRDDADAEVLERFEEALEDLRRAGATVIDSVDVPEFPELRRNGLSCSRFKYDIENYLASLGDDAPVKTLDDIIRGRGFHPSIQGSLNFFQGIEETPAEHEGCRGALENRERFRAAVRRQLEAHRLDAMVYPTWSNPPRLIGDLNSPHGDNSQDLSPHTGFPAITVPMGYTRGTLPAGLQFFGDAWTEARLIALAYAYEQATHHRRPPATTPPLPARR